MMEAQGGRARDHGGWRQRRTVYVLGGTPLSHGRFPRLTVLELPRVDCTDDMPDRRGHARVSFERLRAAVTTAEANQCASARAISPPKGFDPDSGSAQNRRPNAADRKLHGAEVGARFV